MKDLNQDLFKNTELDTLQSELSQQLDFSSAGLYIPANDHMIATIDICYESNIAVAGVDLVAYPNTSIAIKRYISSTEGKYTPGYLSFYEGPVILKTLDYLAKDNFHPHLIIVDGHGLAHPRKFGLACYVGALTHKPTIGIAKGNLLPFKKETLDKKKYTEQVFTVNDEEVGVAIRLQENVNPVFISPGNKINISTSVEIIKNLTTKYRLPDNLRRADQASRTA